MPKVKSKRPVRQASRGAVREAPEPVSQQPAHVNLSEAQLNCVVEKVAEKLAPLLPSRPEPGPSAAPAVCANVTGGTGEVQVQLPSGGISSQIPPNLKQKILSGEFVNLANLINPTANSGQVLNFDSSGQITVLPKSSKRITSIEAWTDAFIVYMDIYCSLHHTQYKDMLKYMHTIRLGAKHYHIQGWSSYDEQFRMKKAQSRDMSWAEVDQELWLLFMCRPKPIVQNETANTQRRCYDFNFKGTCLRKKCTYAHKCMNCGNGHPSNACPNTSNSKLPFRSTFQRASAPLQHGPPANKRLY